MFMGHCLKTGTVMFMGHCLKTGIVMFMGLCVGSGSLSSPMREHLNFAQFYCISVTNFSTVSECILLEII